MRKLGKEVLYDAKFIQGHQLQPGWYKIAKIFILLAVVTAYVLVFGWKKTAVFFVTFLFLMLLVHLVYRSKTKKYTQSWLDFVVVEEDGVRVPRRIGGTYYASILINALLAFAVSQLLG